MDRSFAVATAVLVSAVAGIAGVVLAVEQTQDSRPVIVTPTDPDVVSEHRELRASR